MIFTVQSALILTEADHLFVSFTCINNRGTYCMYWDGTGLMEDDKIYIILFIHTQAGENVKKEIY